MLLNAERASRLMDENGVDGLLATTVANVYYLSGLWSDMLFTFPHDMETYALVSREKLSQPVVVVHGGEISKAITDCFPGTRMVSYGAYYREVAEGIELTRPEVRLKELSVDREAKSDAFDALAAALEESGLINKTVGLDERGINPAYAPELKKRFPRLEIKPAASVFAAIRMVKTKEEIERLRGAVQVTEKAILKAVSTVREGVTEAEIAKEFQKAVIDQGAGLLMTAVRIGRLSVFGLAAPGDTPLRWGDRIYFDAGCRHQGYSSDIARTFAFGDIGERARRHYQALLEGEERGLEAIKAGVKAEEVFHATVVAVREAGIPQFRRHSVGHGMGIYMSDPPSLGPGVATVLEEGMVLNIEPPYYEIGTGALVVEDTLVVSKGPPELLTTMSRKLEVLGID